MKQNIVINREYGSGGREIGKRIAEQLGMPLYDSKILEESVGKKGLKLDMLETFDEKMVGSLLYNTAMMAMTDVETFMIPYKMYGAISETILEAAKKQPCVFLGRCADKILQSEDIPFCNVFIYSTNMEQKKQRAILLDGIDEAHAQSFISKKDKARREYQTFFTQTKFGNYQDYDICLNSAKIDYDTCVKIILDAAGL